MKEIYLDSKQSIEARVDDLLNRMTLDEKIDQMFTTGCNDLEKLLQKAQQGEKIDISATFSYGAYDANVYNRLQEYQLKNSRLKIPFLLASENTHGVSHPACTVFPSTGCQAATFDRELVGKAARASAIEAKILGIRQVYAPNVDISWDQRWGRVEENFGEDPYLTSVMASEIVKNFQSEQVAATVKHYIAYGLGESGLNLAPAHIGELDVREYMLPPFEACIKEANAWSIMPSYNELDGIPVHASKHWMVDVLRKELHFDGLAITDYGASNMLYDFHCVVSRPVEAGKIMCDNRVGMEACSFFGYCDEFRELVKAGKYPISKVDECVKDVLRLKFRLGLFENPFADVSRLEEIHSKEHVAIAKKIAEEGVVLLKNDGLLPLSADKKIALIGPNGNISQLGDYTYYSYIDNNTDSGIVSENSLSLKQVLEKECSHLRFAVGCEFDKTTDEMLDEAEKAAAGSDVVVLAFGDNSKGGNFCGAQGDASKAQKRKMPVTSGEGYDLNEIELSAPQQRVFERIKGTGKPVVLLLYGGRPHAITKQVEACGGILFAFAAGEQGNEAIADILFGRVNPSGKLPISFPRSTGHLPCFYNHKPSARGRFYRRAGSAEKAGMDYVFDTPDALFPFGFGLSYTKFSYSAPRIKSLGKRKIEVSVDVSNIGVRDGDECVLLFLSCHRQRVTPVVKKLRKFARISLQKGETKTVSFVLGKEDFSFVDIDCKRRVASGKYTVSVGGMKSDFEIN